MDPLNAIQLKGAGSRGTLNEGHWPCRSLCQASNAFGDDTENLLCPHDAEVAIWYQGESSPSLIGTTVEYDGACLRDSEGAAGQNSIALIDLLMGEWRIISQRHQPGWQPLSRYISGKGEADDGVAHAGCRDRIGQRFRDHTLYFGPVVAKPVCKIV
jgi:hypothetical protein